MLERINGGEQRDKHSEENLQKVMTFARNSIKHQQLVYFAKKKQIQETQIAKI